MDTEIIYKARQILLKRINNAPVHFRDDHNTDDCWMCQLLALLDKAVPPKSPKPRPIWAPKDATWVRYDDFGQVFRVYRKNPDVENGYEEAYNTRWMGTSFFKNWEELINHP